MMKRLALILLSVVLFALVGYVGHAAEPFVGEEVHTIKVEKLYPSPGRVSPDSFWRRGDWVMIYLPGEVYIATSRGWSMYPAARDGSIKLYKKVTDPEKELKEGDLIQFELDGMLVGHYIYEIGHDDQGWYALTKGFNNPTQDLVMVRAKDVRGVCIAVFY